MRASGGTQLEQIGFIERGGIAHDEEMLELRLQTQREIQGPGRNERHDDRRRFRDPLRGRSVPGREHQRNIADDVALLGEKFDGFVGQPDDGIDADVAILRSQVVREGLAIARPLKAEIGELGVDASLVDSRIRELVAKPGLDRAMLRRALLDGLQQKHFVGLGGRGREAE